jgi:hypothetical protein
MPTTLLVRACSAATAQENLGVTDERGLGVAQDYVLAHMWFNLAASQGIARTRRTGCQNDLRPDRRGTAAGAGAEADEVATGPPEG